MGAFGGWWAVGSFPPPSLVCLERCQGNSDFEAPPTEKVLGTVLVQLDLAPGLKWCTAIGWIESHAPTKGMQIAAEAAAIDVWQVAVGTDRDQAVQYTEKGRLQCRWSLGIRPNVLLLSPTFFFFEQRNAFHDVHHLTAMNYQKEEKLWLRDCRIFLQEGAIYSETCLLEWARVWPVPSNTPTTS